MVIFCEGSKTYRNTGNRKDGLNSKVNRRCFFKMQLLHFYFHFSQDFPTNLLHFFFRLTEQVRYKRWLWWTRFGMAIGALQLVAAIYLMFVIVRDLSKERRSTSCFFGMLVATINHLFLIFRYDPLQEVLVCWQLQSCEFYKNTQWHK